MAGNSEVGFHEVSIPRKGFYKLLLSDGTKVWLNSESSIRYPAKFEKDRRLVTVTGETYFEVAHDPSRPFIASINGKEVEAIGTAFNINGFDGTVTLTEGRVSIIENQRFAMLNPGEQLDESFRKTKIDINPVIAWTRDQFVFKNATITEIMKSLRRWYDCEVIFEDDITYHFNGTIERKVPISRVLQLLEGTGHVQFKIENNTVTVKK
jgi:ferric-dicitrate binding protein FerR (iron transport regulator)